MKKWTDREILRNSVAQVLELDVTKRHGWLEGTGYHLGPPKFENDTKTGDNLIQRGILRREGVKLFLTESAMVRIMHVAMEAVIEDLLHNDLPIASLPKADGYYDDGPERLIFCGLNHDRLEFR